MSSDEGSVGSNEVSEVMSPQVSQETMGPATVTDLPRYHLSRTGIFRVLFALFFLNIYEHYPLDLILSSSPHSFKTISTAYSVHRRTRKHVY